MSRYLSLIAITCCLALASSQDENKWGTYAYDVEIETGLEIPKGSDLDKIVISSHLPTRRAWTQGDDPYNSISNFSLNINVPHKDEIKSQNKGDDQSILSTVLLDKKSKTPTAIQATVRYRVISKDRNFIWPNEVDWSKVGPPQESTTSEVNEMAKRIRNATANPGEALILLSKEVNKRISYDCSVIQSTSAEILKAGKGHCGHIGLVFTDVAKAMGFKVRECSGFIMDTPVGTQSDVHKVRPTFSNRHSWLEVEVPGRGWVELEPTFEEYLFKLSSWFVKANQNGQIFNVDGYSENKPTLDIRNAWSIVGTKQVSPYKLHSIVNFTATKVNDSGNPEAEKVKH